MHELKQLLDRKHLEPDFLEGGRRFIDDVERLRYFRNLRSKLGAVEGTSKRLLQRIDERIEKLEAKQKHEEAFFRMLADSPEAKARMRQFKQKNHDALHFRPDEIGGVSEQPTGTSKWFSWITF